MIKDSVEILKRVMSRSPYFEYLYRNINMIGFNIDNSRNNILFTKEGNNLSIKKIEKDSNIEQSEKYVTLFCNKVRDMSKKSC